MSVRHTVVFDPKGTDYHTFRIPVVISGPTADSSTEPLLLAFCEGRADSASDSGQIDVVLRRSEDGGNTWGDLQVVSSTPGMTCGNPVPLVDETSGAIVLITVRNPANVTEDQLRARGSESAARRRVWLQRSHDRGTTWSPATEITDQVSRDDWGWYATGPCHGITLRHSGRRNRMVVPANHTLRSATPKNLASGQDSGGHCFFSDDGGIQWHLGYVFDTLDDKINVNETCVVELADGKLIFNARNHCDTSPARVRAVSYDGGQSLTHPFNGCTGQFTPDIQGSVVTLDGRTILLSTPADPQRRRNLTVHSSDDGHTWLASTVIHPGPSGYSDLVELASDRVGVLFEAGDTDYREQIRFATIPAPHVQRASAPQSTGGPR